MASMLTGFNLVVGGIMLVSFIGMIICSKKQHVTPAAKPGAIVLLLVVVGCAITFMVHNMSDGDTAGLIENELKFAKSSTYVLGKYLAKTMPNAKVLVIVGQKSESNKRQKVLIEGLKEGFGSSITNIKVEAPKIKTPKGPDGKPMPDMMMPMEEMMKASDFNKLIAKNKNCNLIITLIGLPMDTGGLKIWKQFISEPKKCPKLCIVNGDVSMFGAFIAKGLMPAVVTVKPDAKYTEDPAPADMQKAFDKRYLLVTSKNIKEVAKKYKGQIFRKPK
jgi:hypothetical protein